MGCSTIANAAKGENSLIYGDQDSSTSSTLSFNADVTISNENSDGNLEVKGGEISFWVHQNHITAVDHHGKSSLRVARLEMIQIWLFLMDPYGIESPSAYNDTIVIGNLATGRGSRSTIIGSNAGRGTFSSQNDNTFIGYQSGSYTGM